MKKRNTRKQQIIKASIRLIANNGILNFTTREICREVGIADSTLYRHFGSKLEILSAVINTFEKQFDALVDEINNSTDAEPQKLKKFFLKRINKLSENPDVARIIFSEEIFQHEKTLSEKIISIMKKNQKFLLQIIEQGMKNGTIKDNIQPECLCMMLLGSLRLLVTRWRLAEQKFDINQEAEKLWKSFETILTKEL